MKNSVASSPNAKAALATSGADAGTDRESREIRNIKSTGPTLARLLFLADICLPFLWQAALSATPEDLEISAPGEIRDANKCKPLIEEATKQYRLDKDMAHAVIAAESGHNPKAASHAGGVGLRKDEGKKIQPLMCKYPSVPNSGSKLC
jgi:soluble lytic murein transglycosylase-like protein